MSQQTLYQLKMIINLKINETQDLEELLNGINTDQR